MGLFNSFRRLVPNFVRITAPLTKNLYKGESTHFGTLIDDESLAISKIPKTLVNPTVLALQYEDGKFAMDIDTSDSQFQCVLLKRQLEGYKKPINIWPCNLTFSKRPHDNINANSWPSYEICYCE